MARLILGALLGIVAWVVVVIGVSLVLREVAPALSAAMNVHATAISLAERLAVSFLGTLAAGYVAALVAGDRHRAPLATGILLLLIFVPYHSTIWTQFPLWYHLTFFVSLLLLSIVGGRFKSA